MAGSLAFFREAHKKISFILEIKDQPPIFSFDPMRMRIMLTNMLDNAVAAMGEKDDIFILLERVGPGLPKLSITGRGPGLPPDMANQILPPMFPNKIVRGWVCHHP